MDRFILGVITGIGALVAPLLLGSLFLPGPEGTFLAGRLQSDAERQPKPLPVAETQTDTAQTDSAPSTVAPTNSNSAANGSWTRTNLPKFGFSVETPEAWHNLSLDDLKRMDSAGSFGDGGADALILAVANAKTDDDLTGMLVFLDAGPVRLDALQFMKVMETTIVQQIKSTQYQE